MNPHHLPSAFLLLVTLAFLPACGPDGPSQTSPTSPPSTQAASATTATPASPAATDLITIGGQIAARSASLLGSNLLAALSRTNPAAALEFCSVNAGPILESLPVPPGTRVRRVSHKPRNPDNRASRDEESIITAQAAALAAGHPHPPVLVDNPDHTVTFYSPIVLSQPACLLCHGQPGTEISPDTAAAIARLYPEDKAHGFRIRDVRGLWAVTFPAR